MTRFTNLNTTNTKKADAQPAKPTQPAVQLPLPTPAPKAPEPGKTIVTAAKERADEEQAMARKVLGLAINEQQQFFVNGTKMLACGEETAMGIRKEFDALPTIGEVLDRTIELVKDEQRVDYDAPMKNIAIDAFGVLTGVNGKLIPNGNAMQNIASFGPTTLEPGLRYNVNLWASESIKRAKFRTRNPQEDGTRHCYAVVGPKYGKFDLDDVAHALREHMPQDAHGELFYDGSRWAINVELAPTFKVEELGVGRMLRIRTKISGADDRTKGLMAHYQAVRIRCINCTTITDERLVFKRKHIGDVGALFNEALSHAGEAMEVFASAWREANTQAILDKHDGSKLSAEETFKRLIAHGYVKIPHVKPSELFAKLMDSFEKEPGDNAAAVNNAITRLAHEGASGWKSLWYVEELEQQAGELLFAQVYTLPSMTEEQTEMFA